MQLFRRLLKTLSTYRWSEICMFRKCNFDLPNWISSPRSSFLARDETQLWSNSWFSGLSGPLVPCGGSFFTLRRFRDTKFISLGHACCRRHRFQRERWEGRGEEGGRGGREGWFGFDVVVNPSPNPKLVWGLGWGGLLPHQPSNKFGVWVCPPLPPPLPCRGPILVFLSCFFLKKILSFFFLFFCFFVFEFGCGVTPSLSPNPKLIGGILQLRHCRPLFRSAFLNSLGHDTLHSVCKKMAAGKHREIHEIQQTKMIPVVTRENSSRWNVCELVCGVNVVWLDFNMLWWYWDWFFSRHMEFLEVFHTIVWTLWILSKNLTNFDSRPHCNNGQYVFLIWSRSSGGWREMTSPCLRASASSCVSVAWNPSSSPWSSPLRSSLLTGCSRLRVGSWSLPDNFAVPSATGNIKMSHFCGVNTSQCIESSKMDARCVHFLKFFNVCNQNVSFPNSARDWCLSEEYSR